jgi:hypothetical protein
VIIREGIRGREDEAMREWGVGSGEVSTECWIEYRGLSR